MDSVIRINGFSNKAHYPKPGQQVLIRFNDGGFEIIEFNMICDNGDWMDSAADFYRLSNIAEWWPMEMFGA